MPGIPSLEDHQHPTWVPSAGACEPIEYSVAVGGPGEQGTKPATAQPVMRSQGMEACRLKEGSNQEPKDTTNC